MKKSIRYAVIFTLLIGIFFKCGDYNIAFANTESKEAKLTKNTDVKLEENNSGDDVNIDLTPKYHKARGLYGYVDSKGNWVIEPKFGKARNFSEGVAAVDDSSSINNWGYILPDGTYAIEPKFNGAFDFNNGFAIVGDKAFVALINKKGEYILKTKYYLDRTKTSEYVAGIITDVSPSQGQKKHKYGIITTEGVIAEPQFDALPELKDNFVCFFKEGPSMEYADRTYFTVVPDGTIITLDGEISKVSEGVGLIEYLSHTDINRPTPERRYEFITSEGKIIKSYKDTSGREYFFISANEFSEGFAAAAINKGDYENSWGFLKKDGTWLIEPTYYKAGSFKNGVAPVKPLLSWGYINTDLTWFIEPKVIEPISELHSAFADFIADGLYSQSEHDYCIDKAQTILKDIVKDSMSHYEKLVCIYEYITQNVKYDEFNYGEKNIPRISYSAYGALKYNIAVCDGYSDVLNLMLNLVGIENKQVSGNIKRDGFGHSWNLVKLDGNYYHVDATWDAGNDKKQYFLKSDEYMLKSRIWNRDYYPKAERNY